MKKKAPWVLAALLLSSSAGQNAQALGQRDQAALDAMEAFAAGRHGHVCWQSRRTGRIRIFCSDLDGGNLRQISPNVSGKDHLGALISPDGTRVLYFQTNIPLTSENYYADHVGNMMMVDITDTDGSSAELLVSNVRTYFECRFARWMDNNTIAYIAQNHDTYIYSIPNDTSSKLFSFPGDEFGAIPNRQRTYAIDGHNLVYQINNPGSGGTLTLREDYNGCEGNMTWDGRFAYRVQASTHHFMKMRLGEWWEELFFDNHNSALPSGQDYIYFPQISLDQKFLSLGASANEHPHFDSDYDIFVVPINPSSLEKTGPAVKYSFDNECDSYPDIWVSSTVAPVLALSPGSLSFQAVEGGGDPAAKTVTVTNSGGGTLNNVSVSDNRAWLTVSRSGSGNTQTINHQVDISVVTAGTYNATVTVTCANASNSPQTYNVQLVVSAPAPAMSLSPSSLSFQAVEGGANPAAKTVTVTNSGGQTLNDVSVSDNRAWLSVSRSGTGNNQTINHQVDVGGMAAGTYNATVTVTCGNASNSPLTYNVQLTVNAPGPALSLSVSSLDFVATEGGPDPASQEVIVTNVGGGTLEDVSVYETADWLNVTRSGPGNSQVLTNFVQASALAAGSHEATVRLSCGNATNSPLDYTVHVLVDEQMVLTSIELTASADSILSGGSLAVTARPLDQHGGSIPAPIAWSVSGGGEMSPPASSGEVTEHTSVFQSNGTAGTYSVTASSGGVQASVTLTVVEMALPLRINCGSNEFEIDGWVQDDPFVDGGKDWVNATDVDVAGVENAAPPDVYRSVRHQSPHSYTIPVPDGDYVLRLHFADAYTDRSMDYYAEDQQLLQGLDVSTRAGGVNRALVLTFDVTVSDGDGLQIRAESDGDVFEAGIELMEVVNSPPEVDAGSDRVVEFGTPVDLDGTVIDAWVPAGALSIAWSKVSGPGEVRFLTPVSEDTRAEFSAAGDYVLQLWASDGMLEGSDQVNVEVVEQGQVAITVGSPAGGEVWHAGNTEHIRWSTVNVDRVILRYSTDDGETWTEIAGSVDSSEASWQDYPWSVPDDPSTSCRVRIMDYNGGTHADSAETFEIVSGSGSDIIVQGGCGGCSSGSSRPSAGWLLILVVCLFGRARRS